jgi:dienelactone hydrolase
MGLRFALVLCASIACHAGAQTARPNQAQKLAFASVVCRGEPIACERTEVFGLLFAKPGQTRAVLISHGSQGVDSRMYDYVDALQREGIAAFVLDHWTPRGIGTTHDDYRAASLRGGNEFNMNFDSHLAAELLRARGFEKVGSIGESQGGGAAIMLQKKGFHAVIERNVQRLYQRPFRVRPLDAVVSLYPPCFVRNAKVDAFVATPFLFITGEVDDETPSRYCERYVPWMNERGGNARIIVLEGEGHSFDAPYRRQRNAFGPQYAKCDLLVDERGVTNLNTGESMPGDSTVAMFEKCKGRVYHSGWWKDRFIAVPHWIGFFRQHL